MKRVNIKNIPGCSRMHLTYIGDDELKVGDRVKIEGGVFKDKYATVKSDESTALVHRGPAYTVSKAEPASTLWGCPIVLLSEREQIPVPFYPVKMDAGIVQIDVEKALDLIRESQMRSPSRAVLGYCGQTERAPKVATFGEIDGRQDLRLDVKIEKGRITDCQVIDGRGICHGRLPISDLELEGGVDSGFMTKLKVSTRRYKIDGQGS